MKPVGIALDVLLHRHVAGRLCQRNTRHLVEGDVDEALYVLLVFFLVGSEARGVDELVHLRILVAHGIEHGVLAVVTPEKKYSAWFNQPPKRLRISGMSFFSSAARQFAPGI